MFSPNTVEPSLLTASTVFPAVVASQRMNVAKNPPEMLPKLPADSTNFSFVQMFS
jgi:hypothetical protein